MSTITTIWLVAGFVLAIAEIFTGSFYLLVLAAGAFTGAGLAHFCGLSLSETAVAASVVAVLGVAYVHVRLRNSAAAYSDSSQSLDVGNKVYVEQFREDKTGSAMYRGTNWFVQYVGPSDVVPKPGIYTIAAVNANTLLVS